ncbi:MAG: helix-turn-helix transcriptional regulator [Flavobacteriales bacterium]|nr:helix-turn-helix transcriptional regulator [Flavobacteriales bacterium]
MENRESFLLEAATGVFMRYGIKSVNMDDMARHLTVSKKTLYQYFKDKDDLVERAVGGFCTKEVNEIQEICSRGLNAIDESLEIMKWVLGILKNVHASVQFDLEKYYPSVYRKMKVERTRSVFDCMYKNLKKGQKEGLYRKDFHADIIAKIYISRLDLIFDQEVFPETHYKLTELYEEMFRYHINGIASEAGEKYLAEKLRMKRM